MRNGSNQQYQNETENNQKGRPKTTSNSSTANYTKSKFKDMPSREGFGDGNPDGSSEPSGTPVKH